MTVIKSKLLYVQYCLKNQILCQEIKNINGIIFNIHIFIFSFILKTYIL